MSLAITHFAIGMAVGVGMSAIVETLYTETNELVWAYSFGMLALGPDALKLIPDGIGPESVPMANLFVVHALLDSLDTTDSVFIGTLALLVLGVTIISYRKKL